MSSDKGILQVTVLIPDFAPELVLTPVATAPPATGLVGEFRSAMSGLARSSASQSDASHSAHSAPPGPPPSSPPPSSGGATTSAASSSTTTADVTYRPNGLKKLQFSIKSDNQEATRNPQDMQERLGLSADDPALFV